jgi:hypothetical protein
MIILKLSNPTVILVYKGSLNTSSSLLMEGYIWLWSVGTRCMFYRPWAFNDYLYTLNVRKKFIAMKKIWIDLNNNGYEFMICIFSWWRVSS